MPPGRAITTAALLVLTLVVASPARAWVEVHVEGDDVRVQVDRSGAGRVEHRISLKIAGGPLRSFDLRGVDGDAVPDASGCYVAPRPRGPAAVADPGSLANAIAVSAERMPDDKRAADGVTPPHTIKIRFDGDKGLGRGVYTLYVRYATSFADRIAAEGALAKVTWSGLVYDDGFDSARTTFVLPSSSTPPRSADADTGADGPIAPLVLSNVRRGVDKDELELVRPYAPRGESILWTALVDPRAFAATSPAPVPKIAPAPPTVGGGLHDPAHRAIVLGAAGAIFLLFALLVGLKSSEVERLSRAAGTKARPLVPLPSAIRAVLAGAAVVGGLYLELGAERGTLGAAVLAVAIALAAHRTPLWPRPRRGPGRWLPVSEREAFHDPPRPSGWLDVTSRAGKAFLLLLLGATAGLVAFVTTISPYHATLLAFDASVFLAVFATGRAAELPPDPAVAPAPFLRDVMKRVRASLRGEELRAIGRIRVPAGSPDPDELRLGLAPRSPLQGFLGIEVGVVYARGAGAALALPEVLLRVAVGTPCERAIEKLARAGRSMRGRRPNERVILLTPRLPTAKMTAGIAAALVRAVTDHSGASGVAAPSKRAA